MRYLPGPVDLQQMSKNNVQDMALKSPQEQPIFKIRSQKPKNNVQDMGPASQTTKMFQEEWVSRRPVRPSEWSGERQPPGKIVIIGPITVNNHGNN